MISFRFPASVFLLAIAACGGTTIGDPVDDAKSPPGVEPPASKSPTSPSAPAPPLVVNPGSTISFTLVGVYGRREAANALCGQKQPVFSDQDTFALQLVGTASRAPSFRSIVVTTKIAPPLGTPYAVQLSSPTNFGSQQGQAPGNVGIILFGEKPQALENPLDSAVVTILAFPAHDGEALTARAQLHFASGDTFDGTFSAKVESSEGACAGTAAP